MRAEERTGLLWTAFAVLVLVVAGGTYYSIARLPAKPARPVAANPPSSPRLQPFGNYTLWWDGMPDEVQLNRVETGSESNIHPADYAGPDTCKTCHAKQYEGWSGHSHRWMNALAKEETVKGDFSNRRVSYLGGEVTFTKEGDAYRMRLARGEIRREYTIEQTIGSRFYQYYVGIQLTGPEPADHPVYTDGHVLPFGYWLDRAEWVPAVHVFGEERSEVKMHDPYVPRKLQRTRDFSEYADHVNDLYRSQCNFCHTTFAVGDMLVRHPQLLARHVPHRVDMSFPEYVEAAHPELWPTGRKPSELSDDEFASILKEFRSFDARQHAITLGISCEACHLGAKEHAREKQQRPKFFPHSPELAIHSENPSSFEFGRVHDNVNWACGRCHAGNRPQFAAGMSTWNSTEYTDAMRGSCYSKLTCIECHNPHEKIGQAWSRTAAQDDASCLKCHEKFAADEARTAHTRHSAASEGSHCMNCHMPRVNEGLQDMVRTHMIFSPTNRAMIESNQSNACNQCHVDKSIDWTVTYLKDWYGAKYSNVELDLHYGRRDQPAVLEWLQSDNQAVRMVAADSLTRAKATWAMPHLIRALNDPYLLNRQFARIGIEAMLGIKLTDFGYEYYQSSEERAGPLREMRQKLLPAGPPQSAAQE